MQIAEMDQLSFWIISPFDEVQVNRCRQPWLTYSRQHAGIGNAEMEQAMSGGRLAANPFERKMAANLAPGRTLNLDLSTVERVMGSHTLVSDSSLTFDLTLTSGRAEIWIVAAGSVSIPTIQTVECGIFRKALDWYIDKGESDIRVTFFHPNKQQKPTIVCEPGRGRHEVTRYRYAAPTGSDCRLFCMCRGCVVRAANAWVVAGCGFRSSIPVTNAAIAGAWLRSLG